MSGDIADPDWKKICSNLGDGKMETGRRVYIRIYVG
jgi:hypothetical protein